MRKTKKGRRWAWKPMPTRGAGIPCPSCGGDWMSMVPHPFCRCLVWVRGLFQAPCASHSHQECRSCGFSLAVDENGTAQYASSVWRLSEREKRLLVPIRHPYNLTGRDLQRHVRLWHRGRLYGADAQRRVA